MVPCLDTTMLLCCAVRLCFPQDPDATVGAWENGVRCIDFRMPLRMPQFVKKMVGAESVKVRTETEACQDGWVMVWEVMVPPVWKAPRGR